MRIATRVASVIGATALSTAAMGATAFADSLDNDGLNLINDNNLSLLPIQACGTDIAAVIGVIAPIGSPEFVECNNAPVTDHPSVEN